MLYNHFTEKIIGLQGVKVTNIEENDKKIVIHCQMERKEQKCPCCGEKTNSIHDYRHQVIKDISAFGKDTYINLNKRRYRCNNCRKRFFEKNTFLPRYYRMTNRLSLFIINQLESECSFTSVARRVNLSVSTIIRVFDELSFSPPKELPKTVAIDEFKGNTWGEKYQCIITDPENHRVIDILPNRTSYYVSSYFSKFKNRNDVDFFISDMWRTYADISKVFFNNSVYVVDKYHWIRQVIWAFENVRKQVQKQFMKDYRIYFKRSRNILLKRYDYLPEEQQTQVRVMLSVSPTLSTSYYLKEDFLKLLELNDREAAKKHLNSWIGWASSSGIPQFEKCANTMYSWYTGILNSFICPFTNGFTEGCNNKIKVLKRNAYGYRNFYRFRNRILLMFSHQKKTTA